MLLRKNLNCSGFVRILPYAERLKFFEIHVGGHVKISAFPLNEFENIHNTGKPAHMAPIIRTINTRICTDFFFFPTMSSPPISVV